MTEKAVEIPRRSTLARALTVGAAASVVSGALMMASMLLAAATTDFGDWRWRAMTAAQASTMVGLVCLGGVVMWLAAAWLDGRAPTRPVGLLVIGVAALALVAAFAAVLASVTQASLEETFGFGEDMALTPSISWEERISSVLHEATAIALLAPVLVLAWPVAVSAGRSGAEVGHAAEER